MQFSKEQIEQIESELKSGISVKDIAKKINSSLPPIYRIKTQLEKKKPIKTSETDLESEANVALKKVIDKKKRDNEKKVSTSFILSPNDRELLINALAYIGELTVLSRKTSGKWLTI